MANMAYAQSLLTLCAFCVCCKRDCRATQLPILPFFSLPISPSVSLWSLLQIFMLYISFGTLFEFICWLCRAVAILFASPMIIAVVVGCCFMPDVFISLTSVWLVTSICQNFRTESDLFNCYYCC